MAQQNLRSVENYINLKAIKSDHRLSYGKHAEQFCDLYLPQDLPQPLQKDKLHPVIIMLHGGCWRSQFGLSQLGPLCKSLTQIGFAVYNVEFRRLGNGGGWPKTFEDVALATDALRDLAKQYSLDLSKITTMGHSAGGHLALWLAGRHHLSENSYLHTDKPLQIHRVVSLAGIPDLEAGATQNICRGACQELIGGLPNEVPERYAQTSPHKLLPLNIPQWHLVGELDPIVPVEYLKPYIEKAKQQDEVYFEIIPDIGHFEMVMPDTASWKVIHKALMS